MEEYDLYINKTKPSIGLYVPKGSCLPDISKKDDWIFAGTAAQDLLPAEVVRDVRTNGHAFRDMD